MWVEECVGRSERWINDEMGGVDDEKQRSDDELESCG